MESFPLRGGRRPLTLHATGFRHAAAWLAGGESFTAFDEITDLSVGPRGLRIGTTRNVLLLPRRIFLDGQAPERLSAALVGRIGRLPDGALQLARMAEVEQVARRRAPLRATHAVLVLCVLAYAAELWLGPSLHEAGHFGSTFVRAGEWWRALSANFLHGGLPHIAMNLLGLFVLGELVERPLGTARTAVVLLASAAAGMAMGLVAGYEDAVGASGMVCGLAGAVLAIELRIPDRVPAIWRVPRRLLFVALGADALLSVALPFVAGAVHLGGFVAGGVAALAVLPATPGTVQPPSWARAAAWGAAVLVLLTAGVLGREVQGGPDVLTRRAERLLALPGSPPVLLNNTAWMIVTGESPTPEQIDVALRSAQRAVAQTERSDPNFLDTLAESQFLSGRNRDAIETIDEAIDLAPGERYFVEQRRRFTGERPFDDRPAPPGEADPRSGPGGPEDDAPWPRRLPPGHPAVGDEEPGISV